jgi:hypothetical protein
MTRSQNGNTSMKTLIAAVAFSFAAANPAFAADRNYEFVDNEEMLAELIELDADDIAEMRDELAEARVEIEEAIAEISAERAAIEDQPVFARAIMKIAFGFAGARIENEGLEAFDEALAALGEADAELKLAAVSDEERAETQAAIDLLQTELPALRDLLARLGEAMRG